MASIKKMAQQKDWEYEKNYMYGKVDQYLITARQVVYYLNSQNNFKIVYIPLNGIKDEQVLRLIDYLKENKKILKIRDYDINNTVLTVKLSESLKGYNTKHFDYLIDNLVQYFKEQHIAETQTCVYCHNQKVDGVTKIDKIQYPAHQDCISKAQAELERKKENFNNMDKNYGKGMMGAILFGLLGAIPWILLELFWGYAAVLSLLIGYAAYYGYRQFGGVVTKHTKYLMLIPLFSAIIVSNLICLGIIASSEGVSVLDIFSIDEARRDIISNLLIGILFVLLGYISIFIKIKSDEFNQVIE